MADFINTIQSIVGDGTTPVTSVNTETGVVSVTNEGAVWAKIAKLKVENNLINDSCVTIQTDVTTKQTDISAKYAEVQDWNTNVNLKSGVVDVQYTDLVGTDGESGKIGDFNIKYDVIDFDKMGIVADNADVTATVADNITDIVNVQGYIANINVVAEDLAYDKDDDSGTTSKVNIVASIKTNVDNVADIKDSVVNVDGMSDNITSVLDLSDNITSVIDMSDNITSVVDNKANIDTVALHKDNIDSVVDNVSIIQTVSDNIDNVTLVKNNIEDVNLVADKVDRINTVAVDLEAEENSDVITVADNLQKEENSEILNVAANIADADGSINQAEARAQASADSAVESADSAALASRWANQTEDDGEVTPGEFSAKAWAMYAENWAISDEEVEPGEYSAKYWAQQAEEVAAGDLIDDVVETKNRTFSSIKIGSMMRSSITAITELGASTGSIKQQSVPALDPIPSDDTDLEFTIVNDSNNTEYITIDDDNNQITLLQDATYILINDFTINSSTNDDRTVTFKIVNTADDSVLLEESVDLSIPADTDDNLVMTSLLTLGKNGIASSGEDGLVVKITAKCTDDGYKLTSFNSDIASGYAYSLPTDVVSNTTDIETIKGDDTVEGSIDNKIAAYNADVVTDIDMAIGTDSNVRFDKRLDATDVIEMVYDGDGKLTTVRHTNDGDTDAPYYRDALEYNDDDKLVTVKHYWDTDTLDTASGTTTLDYNDDGKLTTTSYTE